MAKIFKPSTNSRNRKHQSVAKQLPDFETTVEKYDHELKAIAKSKDGRITFVTGGMKGERLKVRPSHYTKNLIHAQTLDIIDSSPDRVIPPCEHFDTCGGCQLQYMPNALQLKEKQLALDSLFSKKLGRANMPWHAPIDSKDTGYRRTARLAVWHEKNGEASIGFRQPNSKHIVDIINCTVLAPSLTTIVHNFRPVLAQLNGKNSVSHLQLFQLQPSDVLVIRSLKALDTNDLGLLTRFRDEYGITLFLQTDKTVIVDLDGNSVSNDGVTSSLSQHQLSYGVDGLTLHFQPKDFIQINDSVNKQMVAQAIDWLDVQQDDVVLDLFSGIGNFTLPLAKRAKEVFAVEGVNDMVRRIKSNAAANGLNNIRAYQADLSEIDDKHKPSWLKPIDKMLLDPARDGAMDVVKKIPILKPNTILYVSCNAATMLRDLEILQSADYHVTKLGLLNMFPHTHHVESMALLEYKKLKKG